MIKLNIKEICGILNCQTDSEAFFCGVAVDSRLYKKGNAFFALKGQTTDGHYFLEKIAEMGCHVAFVDKNYQGSDFGLELIRVNDTLQALQQIANYQIKKLKSKIVAITGSVGKTTTKEFVTTLLKEKYHVASSPGNSNSQVGIPLTILNHTDGTEDILVLEMGMTHFGNIKKLTCIAPPDCAVITAVELVHACNFNSIDEIALAKAEILSHPETKMAIINRDIKNFNQIKDLVSYPIKTFSYDNKNADYTIDMKGLKIDQFPIKGKHYETNFLAAVAVAIYFNMTMDEINRGLLKVKLPDLREQKIEKKGILFINDAYNASPVSVKAALLNMPVGSRKVAVLSDMLELGKWSKELHEEIGSVALSHVNLMFCYGKESIAIYDCFQKANKESYWFETRHELRQALEKKLKQGDVVLVKGSRGTEISKIVDELEL